MWSLIDFLVEEARKQEMAEHLLFHAGAAAFVLLIFFLRIIFG